MNEPTRLSERGGTGYEASLIRAARTDAPSAGTEKRLLLSLGVGVASAVSVATSAATAAAKATVSAKAAIGNGGVLTLVTGAKWFGVGIVGGAVAIGAGTAGQRLVGSTSNASAPSVSVDVSPSPVKPAASTFAAPAASSAPTSVLFTPQLQPELDAGNQLFGAEGSSKQDRSPVPVVERDTSLLRAEVALIAEARGALASGDGKTALLKLDRYDHDFSNGKLAPEAALLRLQSLVLVGRRQEAQAQARAALQANPTGPYASQIKEIAPNEDQDDSEITTPDGGHSRK